MYLALGSGSVETTWLTVHAKSIPTAVPKLKYINQTRTLRPNLCYGSNTHFGASKTQIDVPM